MAMTLGRRRAVLIAALLMALMMAVPTASAEPDNGKGFGQGQGGGDVTHGDNGKHTAKGGGQSNNPDVGGGCTFNCGPA
jgi:hypothetical protein